MCDLAILIGSPAFESAAREGSVSPEIRTRIRAAICLMMELIVLMRASLTRSAIRFDPVRVVE